MTSDNADSFDTLAAEYVLGTLRGAACERFEAQMRADPEIARRVLEWEARLAPLVDGYEAAPPSDNAWAGIERRLFSRGAGKVSRSIAFVAWWRRLALGFGALAAIAIGFATWTVLSVEPPQCYAVLTDDRGLPAAVVFDRRNMQELVVLPVGSRLASASGGVQLWILAGDRATAVGLVHADRETRLALDKPMATAVMAADARLLITLDRPGDSPGRQRIAEGAVAMPPAPSLFSRSI